MAEQTYLAPFRAPRTQNLELRRARQSLRLSQAQFAEAIRATGNAIGVPNSCTKRLVQKWEAGEHTTCRPDYLRVLQTVTGLPVRELGFTLPADYSSASANTQYKDGTDAALDPLSSDGTPDATASALPSGMARYFSDEMLDGAMDRLRHALNHPSGADLRTAGFVEAATARLFGLEHHSPSRLLARTVDRHLAMVTALLTAARQERVRHSLMVSTGCSALLAGWLAFDRGDIPSSHELWGAAIDAAQATAHEGLFAATLTCQSYAAARHGDPGTAWQLAHTAALRTPDDPRATAWATARIAHFAARLGESEVAVEALDCSLMIGLQLPDPQPGDGTAPWTRSFDQSRLLSSSAHTAALLRDPSAVEYAAQAIAALGPAKVKSRAVVLAEATLTAAITGELSLCLDYGSAAASVARDLDVSVAADLLHEVTTVVLPCAGARPIRELLAQLSQVIRTSDLERNDKPWQRASTYQEPHNQPTRPAAPEQFESFASQVNGAEGAD